MKGCAECSDSNSSSSAGYALRIYALPEVDFPEVEIRYYAMPRLTPGGGYAEAVVLLRTDRLRLRTFPPVSGFRLHPSFGLIANVGQFPELASGPAVWIEVAPVTPGARVWALASVTDNATQQVTLVTSRVW